MSQPIIAITGSGGFLGSHTLNALKGCIVRPITLGDYFDKDQALYALDGADKLIHIAGANRGDNVGLLNFAFAWQLSHTLTEVKNPPSQIVFANSTQAGNGTEYGNSKQQASEMLCQVAQDIEAEFVDLKLTNLFGEGGKPHYNMVTSTFCHLLATNQKPEIAQDKELELLYVKDAANLLAGITQPYSLPELIEIETVSGLLARLQEIAELVSLGYEPDTSTRFQANLVKTFLSFV
jgi:UDP-2-acetamido-2,6-beta-L-arabino-hexul-4-ose reductase